MMRRRELLVAVGVALAVCEVLAAAGSGTVRGRVTGGGRPLAGVLVSDGCRIARTNASGDYALGIGSDSGRFVFVTTPRGYWTDAFYAPMDQAAASGRADFALVPKDQPDRFDFVFACDLGTLSAGPDQVGIPKTKASIREINGLVPTPAFILVQGDICIRANSGKNIVECLSTSNIPVRVGIGNHEIMVRQPNPYGAYERLFGPTYYAFDWGPVHFIVLNGNKANPGGRGNARVHGAVEGSELAWLKADLAAQPAGKPIVVGVHIPIVSTYPARRTDLDDGPFWETPNDKLLTDLFARYRVRMVLQGHMHENERITVGGVEYVESVSLSGSWWKSGRGFERATDGSPRGYRIVSVDGKKITHRYHSSCESHVDRRGEFMGLNGRIAAKKDAVFTFNCYDAPAGSTARACVDDGPWRPMTRFKYKASPIDKPHHFRSVIDRMQLRPGRHTIEARVTWPDGTVVAEKETFLVGDRPAPKTKNEPVPISIDAETAEGIVKRWEKAIRAFEAQDRAQPPPKGAILFVGSSSARLWDLAKCFPKLTTINRGFGGSQFIDAAYYADRIILPYRPRAIVVYDGDNDLAAGKRPEQVLADCRMLVRRIHKALPKARIIVLSVKVCESRWRLRDKVLRVNAMIEKLAHRDPRITYLDVATPLLNADGRPRNELFLKDKLHLNAEGYRIWSSIVRPHISSPDAAKDS